MATQIETTEPAPAAAPEPPLAASHRVVIQPRHGWQPIDFAELWRYRELLWILALRDIKVRYKQTVLGAAWAVIQPLFTMIVFVIFFGRLGGMSSYSEIPYPLLTLTALLPWQFFANSLSSAGNSLVASQNLITKVYFPRLVVPIAAIVAGLVDLAIAFALLLVMMAVYGFAPPVNVLALPAFVLLAIATSLAAGLWLSALNVEFRDVRYAIPFLIQMWMFLSPVAYPGRIVPPQWQWVYGLNPMVGVIEGFQWALLGTRPPESTMIVSCLATLAMLVGGLFYFRRVEKTFADVV